MLFNSIEYLVFLPLVFVLYWLLGKKLKLQNILLLVASYVFYAWWDWRFLSLIIYSSLLDYMTGWKIHRAKTEKNRKLWLVVSLVSNLGLLAVFKYFNFFTESFADLANGLGWQVNSVTVQIILPVGISFYTFQTMSYSIDIYRRKFTPTKDLIAFATYVGFFPQLVAGPIERAANLLPQIEKPRTFDFLQFKEGFFQILVGLFRKIVIADNLGIYVDAIYANPQVHNGTSILLATFFYAFQIYYDFAGYSDIAIGSAKLLGFRFRQNFDTPYFASSVTDFWRRWHMSLSSWLRDYLYISLGGNRKGIRITYRNLMLTMLLGGLWHGSSWNFVIWGGMHGLVLSLERYFFHRWSPLKTKWWNHLYIFPVVLLTWIFFRSPDFSDSMHMVRSIFTLDFGLPFIGNSNAFLTGIMMLIPGILFDAFLFRKNQALEDYGRALSTLSMVLFSTCIIFFIVLFYSTSNNFIYFQF